jgi:hypothetical protein
MEKITEIFVLLENKPSKLGDLCGHLAENGINIDAIGLFQDAAKLYVPNVTKAQKVLNKLGYTTELRDVLKVDLKNEPGALAEVTSKLGNKGVNIEYCYGTLSRKGDAVSVILDVSDLDRALEILKS